MRRKSHFGNRVARERRSAGAPDRKCRLCPAQRRRCHPTLPVAALLGSRTAPSALAWPLYKVHANSRVEPTLPTHLTECTYHR